MQIADSPRYDAVLFDLDGTLTDPYDGISRSFLHALERLGVPAPAERLDWCIGPPISESFAALLGTDDPVRVAEAVAAYRERYAELGIVEQEMYPCVAELLHRLHDTSRSSIYLATSKPRVFAERILVDLGIAGYFHGCYGAELDGRLSDKGELIGHLLASEGLDPARTVMIGDRRHDVIGARRNGLASIGVAYGYGGRAELEESGADHICDDVAALARHLLGADGAADLPPAGRA